MTHFLQQGQSSEPPQTMPPTGEPDIQIPETMGDISFKLVIQIKQKGISWKEAINGMNKY